MIGHANEWAEFSPFDDQAIELHRRAMKLMNNGGEIDLKALLEINRDFDFYALNFLKRAKLRQTKDGEAISYWDIFGGVTIPRPEYAAFVLSKFMMIIVAQNKLIKMYREKLGDDMSAEKLTIKGTNNGG